MDFGFGGELFLVITIALFGGAVARFIKLQSIVGYILAGIIFGSILPVDLRNVEKLAEIGAILLLFSVGVELSFKSLSRFLRVALFGAIIQIILVIALSFVFLTLVGLDSTTALVLSLGFSLSSTAVVVKILSDRGETDTIHGQVMIGWLLIQDLAVIPMMVILPALSGGAGSILMPITRSLLIAAAVVSASVLLGRLIAPFIIHRIASTNSRELLVLAAVALALGTATATSFFGISAAIGAFLAGIVLSETQENHAIFAETRPLRDLFVAVFFVTLGFLVKLSFVANHFFLVVGIVLFLLIVKVVIVLLLSLIFGRHGKSALAISLGLAQIGEFSFIIFSFSSFLGLISAEAVSIGISTALVSLLITPMLFRLTVPLWRRLKTLTSGYPSLNKFFLGWEKRRPIADKFKNHVIVCGYGRVGSWVGKALERAKVDFIVVDYNQRVVSDIKKSGGKVIYGDSSEPDVLNQADIESAKAIVIAIPDRMAQEEIIAHIQTIVPKVKIFARSHFDEDWKKLSLLRVHNIVQPEFEAAIRIIRSIFISMGKSKEEVRTYTNNLRRSRRVVK
jgi:CPA2 family monovalent cation:H+ antiporter-2